MARRSIQISGDPKLRVSHGYVGIEADDEQVWVDLPDRFGHGTLYNFGRSDWERMMALFDLATPVTNRTVNMVVGGFKLDDGSVIYVKVIDGTHVGVDRFAEDGECIVSQVMTGEETLHVLSSKPAAAIELRQSWHLGTNLTISWRDVDRLAELLQEAVGLLDK